MGFGRLDLRPGDASDKAPHLVRLARHGSGRRTGRSACGSPEMADGWEGWRTVTGTVLPLAQGRLRVPIRDACLASQSLGEGLRQGEGVARAVGEIDDQDDRGRHVMAIE